MTKKKANETLGLDDGDGGAQPDFDSCELAEQALAEVDVLRSDMLVMQAEVEAIKLDLMERLNGQAPEQIRAPRHAAVNSHPGYKMVNGRLIRL